AGCAQRLFSATAPRWVACGGSERNSPMSHGSEDQAPYHARTRAARAVSCVTKTLRDGHSVRYFRHLMTTAFDVSKSDDEQARRCSLCWARTFVDCIRFPPARRGA